MFYIGYCETLTYNIINNSIFTNNQAKLGGSNYPFNITKYLDLYLLNN